MKAWAFATLASAVILSFSESGSAQQFACDAHFLAPRGVKIIETNIPIRLSDIDRRNYYARTLFEKADLLFAEYSSRMLQTEYKLSSVYSLLLEDPTNLQYYLPSPRDSIRLNTLRKTLFGTSNPNKSRKSPANTEKEFVGTLLDTAKLQELLGDGSLAPFPMMVIGGRPSGKLFELWRLEYAGDILINEAAYTADKLIDLNDGGMTFHLTMYQKGGSVTTLDVTSVADALQKMQLNKPQLCYATLTAQRLWLDPEFIEKYFALRRLSGVYLGAQLDAWRDGLRPGMGDLNIFSFLSRAFILDSFVFKTSGDNIVLHRLVVSKLLNYERRRPLPQIDTRINDLVVSKSAFED